ncbi:MAG: recombinase family protein [Oscillospiraceae bacterium]|nr:recombinase family protein [Oscillospiraceae bacterium]
MRKITRIEGMTPCFPKRKRVCAYARVSSGNDAMLHSLSAQVSYYSALIQKNPEWAYVGVYADEAVTGTKDSRAEFSRMLGDCRAGHIDMVITKSISRFARNTVTLLKTVRELKALGIGVRFEEQSIDTLTADGELMLTILASYAQEESRSASENCLWRIRERFERGEPVGLFTMFGYRYFEGRLVICEEEAKIVRMIFADYLSGMGSKKIADKLRAMNVPTVFGGVWTADRVAALIKNEKFTGNSLLQKAYTVDHLSKLRRINRGEMPKYYAENTHPAIIDMETFKRAQAIMESRRVSDMEYLARYPFSSKVVCAACGKSYKRKITHGIAAWQCSTYLNEGAHVCPSVKIRESVLQGKAAEALGTDGFDADAFEERVEKVIVPEACRLVFVMKDGSEVALVWKPPSRRESWTKEMRLAARERRLAVIGNA